MNRCLLQALLVLLSFSVLQGQTRACPESTICSIHAASFFSAAVASPSAVAPDSTDGTEEEYIESKFFPKKGSYSDWLAANRLNNQGIRYARSGNYKNAISMFQQAIQRYGHDYTYYEHLGAALHKSGNLEKAESTTEIATQMAPKQWGPWYNLGIILTKEHQYKRAIIVLRKAKALHVPTSKSAGLNKLITALQLKLNAAGTDPGRQPTAHEETAVAPEKVATPETTVSQTEPVSPDVNSSAPEPAPVLDSNTANPNNPYTTVPEVSPVPAPQSTPSEKGN